MQCEQRLQDQCGCGDGATAASASGPPEKNDLVGWMVATCESAVLAEKLIAATCDKQGITRGQLSIHADRGSSMTSKPVALLLADLGVTQSHSARTSPTTTPPG